MQFIDLEAQQSRIRSRIDKAIARVLDHGAYIMGPEVADLEVRLAKFVGVRHCISCSSGTDALLMSLMALGIGPGDAVICPAFTFSATPETIALIGATPVFSDVDPASFNLSPSSLSDAIAVARSENLVVKAVIAVDLFGQPAVYDAIEAIALAEGMTVICDAAQSFGATYKDRRVGQIGHVTTTSFFPAKPFGCYGDGGAIFTDDDDLADRMQSIRLHGKGAEKYDIVRIGINGRLDTLQAAVLIEKLAIFPDEIVARGKIAQRYNDRLGKVLTTPRCADGASSVWAQYTVRLPAELRDRVASAMKADGVPTAVYYPRPVHHQTPYRTCPRARGGLAWSEVLPSEVLSLPMHPYLSPDDQERVCAALTKALNEAA